MTSKNEILSIRKWWYGNGEKGEIRVVRGKKGKKGWQYIALQKDLSSYETSYCSICVSYLDIKTIIEALVKEHGKEEVEKELGVKIKEIKRPHGGR